MRPVYAGWGESLFCTSSLQFVSAILLLCLLLALFNARPAIQVDHSSDPVAMAVRYRNPLHIHYLSLYRNPLTYRTIKAYSNPHNLPYLIMLLLLLLGFLQFVEGLSSVLLYLFDRVRYQDVVEKRSQPSPAGKVS